MKRLKMMVCGFCLLLGITGLMGEPEDSASVMAVDLYKLIESRDVTWPADKFQDSNAPFIIGVLGDPEDPVIKVVTGPLEERVEGKALDSGRRVIIKSFASAAEARQANILWVSASERTRFPEIFHALEGARVLTVSNADDFVEKGGIVQLQVGENSQGVHVVQFREIDNGSAQRQGISISSELLKLARMVRR